MAYLTGKCPNCGLKINFASSSIDTLRICQGCRTQFILREPPPQAGPGCAQIAFGFLIVGAIGILTMFACCGGIALLGSREPHRNPNPLPAQKSDNKTQVASSTPPKPVPVQSKDGNPTSPAAKQIPALKLSDDELYKVIDETYGYPIANVDARAFIKELRAQGFEGPEAKINHDGLPGSPESRLMLGYYLERQVDHVKFTVDVVTDYRYQVRNVEFMLTSFDGKSATARASELLTPTVSLLKRPKITKWFIDHSGTKITADFEGTFVESVGGSPQSWIYNVKGSLSQQSAPAVADKYHSPREWSDATGSFKVTASFVSLANGKVKLRKENGAIIEVDIEVLSDGDKSFVNKLRRS